ncbi:hypothetical protein DSCO28_20730 [Desulfosarcina ovata subsp. sediminis]|uniref:Putative adhesin Stv domain-containing protein n=1 Tax=Desulfosarcina ovata subsp. sediminis TaxID=885957 RepID=A0A5K7ZMU8_9BACT|nr:hypothetical protein [Desulfosarcina ovata]BBO81507.1 hypothetical protein DSCO28_20730 [Desulfosarcina ovata subsp. sediminis]
MAVKKSYGSGRFWLFKKAGNNRLIISAHGGAPSKNKKFLCPGNGWNAVVYRTSIHGLCTTSQVQDIVDYRNHGGPWSTGGNTWQQSGLPGQQTDWVLSQYADIKGNDEDSYNHYLGIAENENFDVASPRERWFSKEMNVSALLASMPHKSIYKEIWFSFCLDTH